MLLKNYSRSPPVLVPGLLNLLSMERYIEVLWNDYLEHIETVYKDRLTFPLKSYFTTISNLIIFDLKKELDPDVKELIILMFDAIYD